MRIIAADEKELLAHLMKYADLFGSQAAAARCLGISPSYFNDLLSGRRVISKSVARKLGYKREYTYIKEG